MRRVVRWASAAVWRTGPEAGVNRSRTHPRSARDRNAQDGTRQSTAPHTDWSIKRSALLCFVLPSDVGLPALHCFYTVGLAMLLIKIAPEMTYYVSGATLNLLDSHVHSALLVDSPHFVLTLFALWCSLPGNISCLQSFIARYCARVTMITESSTNTCA